MTRYRWPNGAQCAVALSFDEDAESGYVFTNPEEAATRLDEVEQRRFGPRTGTPRILRLLEKYGLTATWFVPGYTVEHHTDAIIAVQAAGHELACHGNVHEALHTLDEAAERRVLDEQLAIFQRHLGLRPVGYRSPSWSLNARTPALLKEYGFTYDSSLMGDDIPYFVDTPGGKLAEVPIQWLLDDAPFYRHVYGHSNQMTNPMHVVDQWLQEFRAMYQENGCFVLTCHPAWSGRAGRIAALEWLIRQMRAEPDVWWATCRQIAEWQIETDQNTAVSVPISKS